MPRLSRVLAALLAGLSVGVLVLVGSQSAASAAPPCVVTYQPNLWTGGFTANVGVTNNGAPVTAWTVTWTYTGSQQITSGWNADVRQTGKQVTAKNVAHNGSLATGATAQFGFQGTSQGTNDAPVDFALNGVACNGQPPTTTTTTTTVTTTTTSQQPPGPCPAGAVCD
ncbi:MAG: cellulose-binding domain-containing protein, partial [Umezawaea sp.]